MRHTETFLASKILNEYSLYMPVITECSDLELLISEFIKQYSDIDDLSLRQIDNFETFCNDIPLVYVFILFRSLYFNEFFRQVIDRSKLLQSMAQCRNMKLSCFESDGNAYKEDLLMPKALVIEQRNKIK